jgi:hypothetical protein
MPQTDGESRCDAERRLGTAHGILVAKLELLLRILLKFEIKGFSPPIDGRE